MKKAQISFGSLALVGAASLLSPLGATPKKSVRLASAPKSGAQPAQKMAPLPNSRFLTYSQIKQWQQLRAQKNSVVAPGLQPFWEGHSLKAPMRDLLAGPSPDFGALVQTSAGQWKKVEPKLFAQAFPRPVAPASPSNFRRPSRTNVPRWVRYPLEFQLAGIGLGTRAVDKDRFNRIDRYGLFAIHGNPTAVVRATLPPAGAAGAGAGVANASGMSNLTLLQTPPEAAALFPQSQQGGLPDWALAVTVQLDNNHVQWLYKRETYSMGFVVDRLGFVDAIVVAGFESPIIATQLEDPVHTVQLGDDLRKVLFRYGYPDDIVPLAADPIAEVNSQTAANTRNGGVQSLQGGTVNSNGIFRTYDLRYEQSYNAVFTIRNNRVVRIYIFGDPDFFNAQRRSLLRTRY